ncbi:hypothetical protein B9G55_21500 [Saccharibacillus sp. O16]|nr:hypothetical protein B9G55_21500 [Saccharibacillus sp. O16]
MGFKLDYTSLVLALLVFSLMLMVIRLRFEVRVLREDLDRLAARPGQHRPSVLNTPNGESPARVYGQDDERLRVLVAKGRKIEAIKEARQMYDMSLLDAKNYVESL